MIDKPITYSEQDLSCMTEELAGQIEAHNWHLEQACRDGE